jgi:photosystem II stability/assembly factor-like uncharacterized protein
VSVRRILAVLLLLTAAASAQVNPKLFQEMRWRNVGPFRGGRVKAVAGVPSQPNVFYFAQVNGGVWKSIDYGHAWAPIFDQQPTGSVGSIAVALSDPNIIYVGSGEGLHRPDLSVGDGVYKSTDAGKTWTHLGLRDGQQIPQIAVDPHDANRLYVAVLGHPYGPNEERGIFRSTDGGQTFQKVLYKDENTGGSDVQIDPAHPDTVYACLWEAREGAWENGAFAGISGGIFKSTDGGTTWNQLKGGLPEVVQANLAIAPSNPNRIYATAASLRGVGIYRSEDAGGTWTKITDDPRPAGRIGGGDLAVPKVDPKNPDVVYITSTVSWKSTDGGKTWNALRGAPGGDDYQNIWINPNNPDIILLGSDQGAVVTVNGGQSWSDWYNQPTAQVYHVTADNAFPYRLCSGQQESGSVCISSRGNDGEITMREWHPVAADEYSYVAPDPYDPDIVYGGKVTKYDRRTTQVQSISPKPLRSPDFRMLRTEPVVFSPADKKTLFFAGNTIWKTMDGGNTWTQISPDLTRKTWDVPASVGKYRDTPQAKPAQRGVVYALGLSSTDVNLIWAGTDDGLIHVTRDGGEHWTDVTPPTLAPWMKVSIIDAGHFDNQTAYAAINTLRLDDMRPHILRTHDGGKTWTEIVNGIPPIAPVNVVREDPKRKGLLFAGTEREVYVTFDDGDHWQSLRLNMPATSIRDLIIKNHDLAVGTHGRGFWILDNITPLYQIDVNPQTFSPTGGSRERDVILFQPQDAMRVRWNTNSDTPLPPEVPAGENPPDGAMIDYALQSNASGPVTIEITDLAGKLVRKYSSADPVEPMDPMLAIPKYWPRSPQTLSAEAGMHRFLWDLHYPPVPGARAEYPISAVAHNTAPAPTSPWVAPGQYMVKLTANGKSYVQPLKVNLDPRVTTAAAGIEQQFTLSKQLYDDVMTITGAIEQSRAWRQQLSHAPQPVPAADAIKAFQQKLDAVVGREAGRRGGGPPPQGQQPPAESLNVVRAGLNALMDQLQQADVAPTQPQVAAVGEHRNAVGPAMSRWSEIQKSDLPALNQQLKAAGVPELK